MKYTKREWKSSHQYPHTVYATDGKRPPTTTPIAKMTDTEECEANARLIASAPGLYEALRSLLKRYIGLAQSGDAGFWDAEEEEEVIQARQALAEAEGK